MAIKDADVKADLMGFDEALAMNVFSLVDENKVKLLSDLFIDEIPFVALLYTISRKHKLVSLSNFVDEFLKLRVSLDRKGRDEIVLVGVGGKKEEKKSKVSISELFSGLR